MFCNNSEKKDIMYFRATYAVIIVRKRIAPYVAVIIVRKMDITICCYITHAI